MCPRKSWRFITEQVHFPYPDSGLLPARAPICQCLCRASNLLQRVPELSASSTFRLLRGGRMHKRSGVLCRLDFFWRLSSGVVAEISLSHLGLKQKTDKTNSKTHESFGTSNPAPNSTPPPARPNPLQTTLNWGPGIQIAETCRGHGIQANTMTYNQK